MRKSLFALLAILLAFPAVYAQDAASRQTKYNQLLKQRQELMSWSEENPIAPRFIGMMKEREARDIRTHLYTHFFDLRKNDVAQFRRDLRQELQKADEVPFVTFNRLPAENLKKIARNPQFLIELLKLYPDNAATLSDAYLTKLFKQNESLELLLVYYLLYLKSYNEDPSCVNFTKGEKRQLSSLYKAGNMERFYQMLSLYAASNLTAKKQQLARNYVQKSLASALRL